MAIGDMQQKNVVAADAAAAHAENPLTAVFLEPRDSKGQCADNYATGASPVNLALTKLRQLGAGLRGAIFGDFAGAIQHTARSLYANLTAGSTHAKPAGTLTASGPAMAGVAIEAETGDIQATEGDIIASAGKIRALVDYIQSVAAGIIAGDLSVPAYSQLDSFLLRFIGTVASGANPASTLAAPNRLYALNIPKAWVSFTTNGMAGTACIVKDGHGITSVVRTVTEFTVTFATAFDSAEYAVMFGQTGSFFQILTLNKLVGSCQIQIADATGTPVRDPVLVTGALRIDLIFFGRQTT